MRIGHVGEQTQLDVGPTVDDCVQGSRVRSAIERLLQLHRDVEAFLADLVLQRMRRIQEIVVQRLRLGRVFIARIFRQIRSRIRIHRQGRCFDRRIVRFLIFRTARCLRSILIGTHLGLRFRDFRPRLAWCWLFAQSPNHQHHCGGSAHAADQPHRCTPAVGFLGRPISRGGSQHRVERLADTRQRHPHIVAPRLVRQQLIAQHRRLDQPILQPGDLVAPQRRGRHLGNTSQKLFVGLQDNRPNHGGPRSESAIIAARRATRQ